jgi:F0F1-type ATP synthase assembly protein I
MKLPRLTIANLMALVLLVALDVWVCKALPLRGPSPDLDLSDLLIFGALPMANVLAIGLVPLARSRVQHAGRRPALVGFEVGGLVALLLFLVCALNLTHPLHEGVGGVLTAIGLVPPGPVFLACATTLLLVPQLALALLGGWLCRRYAIRVRIIVERRTIPVPEPGPAPERLFPEGI